MSGELIPDFILAERFDIDLARLHRLRREKGWPCVKFSRYDIRFTEEQVQQILAIQTSAGPGWKKPAKKNATGQTARSAGRSA